MKNLLIFSIIPVLLLVSCSKELDQTPISSATSETFYATTDDFMQGINAVYASLADYPDRQLNLSETRSDNLYAVSQGGVRDWEGINDLQNTIASNPYVSEAWSTNYNGIFRANTLLDQLDKNGNVLASPALKTRLEAEARFLRAFFYFDLVRWFGEVPLTDHALTGAEAVKIPRSPVADIYQLIISDLEFAITNLPESYDQGDKGRATKYAAEGILAAVYMARSGPTYQIKGPGIDSNEWALALPLLNDIIGSGQYALLPDYSSVFSYSNEDNAEVIFDIQYATGFNPVVGGSFPALLVPNGYFQSLGQNVSATTNIRPVSNDLYHSYASNDLRKDASIHAGYVTNGIPENRPFFTKYLDITKIPTNMNDWPINFIVLRYADILLRKAECILHGANGTQADADNLVNKVRQRAGLAPISHVTLPQLMEERRKEFAAEGLRWHDLVRSGTIATVMSAWIANDDVQHQIQPFSPNDIIYPIPQSELDIVHGLYSQNPGY